MHTLLTEGELFLSLCLIKVWQVYYATDPDRLSFVLVPSFRPLVVLFQLPFSAARGSRQV